MAQSQRGKATFYSKRATGSRTSSGERLHHDSLTCAHRTYPFGTLLKVTNVNTGESVVVRVTDRGPYARGRIIDLSWAAAKELDILGKGVAMVEIEKVGSVGIPYRPVDRIELPEMDFDVSQAGYSFIDDWKKGTSEKTTENSSVQEGLAGVMPEKASSRKATASVAPRTAKKRTPKMAQRTRTQTPRPTEKAKPNEQKSSNTWSNVFDKIKNWGKDLF